MGVVVRCRMLGMLRMEDESGIDAKLIAVPVEKLCPMYKAIQSTADLPELLLNQIEHFFEHYKDLEKGKWVKIQGWADIEAAKQEILDGVKRYETEGK
jgi:inorganic pyrophosphatase